MKIERRQMSWYVSVLLYRYSLYTRHELLDLLTQVATGKLVEIIPSQQGAYNLLPIKG
jgi:hypothetical protein